ncbi:MAG: RIP metalloprotease RseP [Archangium gephyra]|uniref:RIP metalloprotease RseP n=1 Tax=Archangium gephyra TaxID=48 RepID=A0A2W5TDB3_9BACT|nr:MAG: RIP metalloprotease RseP [Archangium gephyra]
MGFFQDAIYIGIFLGVLVAVHEAGHFFAAKWAGVKVLKFSIGFGPSLLKFRRGETEYQLALVPLGGFVAMAGQQPGEDVEEGEDPRRTFLGAPWWKRVIILLAGPGANLLFAVAALFFLFLGDSEDYASRVGAVEPGSPAAVAGLRPGDLIVSIDDTPVRTFSELSKIASASADRELSMVVERDGKNETLKITPANVETLGLLEVQKKGRIGISLSEQAAVLGVPADSAAANAGLKTFDRVVALNGEGIRSARQLNEKLTAATGTVKLQVVRFKAVIDGVAAPQLIDAEVTLGDGEGLARLGAEGGDAYVWQVRPNTPAAAFGIKVGDRFTAVNGAQVHSVGGVEDRMALARKKAVDFEWVSNGETHKATVGPLVQEGNAKYCMTVPDFGVRFGAPGLAIAPVAGEMVTVHFGPWDAFVASMKKLPEGVGLIAKVLGKLTTGDVPLESMGGPLQIAQVATQSAQEGVAAFVGSMYMVSVNLALVNLLPIPILDGFGILTALWEAIRRRPIPMRAREIATYFGFAVIALLMVVAFRNDIARLLFC